MHPTASGLARDLTAGLVVFLVALPLCLGIALASDAPLFSGVVAGVIGGVVVGLLSGSHTSVSGPAAGLTAVVAAQIVALGSFEAFLLAVTLAGLIQIALGLARAGFLAAFFPASVVQGLLAAIGVILILKQVPHLVGWDADPEGDFRFVQPDRETTFSELARVLDGLGLGPGAAVIGLSSLALLVAWDRVKWLKASVVPAPLVVVLYGVGMVLLFRRLGDPWAVDPSHLVAVTAAADPAGFLGFFRQPDASQLANPAVYLAAA
ncbi:MAG TPA: SulP family inorganic anion transporter, partial [Urbifossiella sp.]|nr:SulP family inorganic anion transporter [Urbifossiella sp.]